MLLMLYTGVFTHSELTDLGRLSPPLRGIRIDVI